MIYLCILKMFIFVVILNPVHFIKLTSPSRFRLRWILNGTGRKFAHCSLFVVPYVLRCLAPLHVFQCLVPFSVNQAMINDVDRHPSPTIATAEKKTEKRNSRKLKISFSSDHWSIYRQRYSNQNNEKKKKKKKQTDGKKQAQMNQVHF